jgi:ferrous iron transport protein B
VGIHGYEKVKGFVQKAGTIILAATILLWALSNFNFASFNGQNQAEYATPLAPIESSFLASAGKAIAPIFKPTGFGEWRPTVGIATGWIAKEMVVVTLAQLYADDISEEYLSGYFAGASEDELAEFGFEDGKYDSEAAVDIYTEVVLMEGFDEHALPTLRRDIPTRQAALAYMVFNLLCMPCFAAVGAMKRELKSWRVTLGQVGIQMLTAYIVALFINVVGNLLF